jgi:ATP-dependent DNA helicase RecG
VDGSDAAAHASHCVLLYQPPLSRWRGRARLDAMRETSDGFVLAERDLELRGPGELLGTRQTGRMARTVAGAAPWRRDAVHRADQ